MVETVCTCCLTQFRHASVSKNYDTSLEPCSLLPAVKRLLVLALFALGEKQPPLCFLLEADRPTL